MTATLAPAPPLTRRGGRWRDRVAAAERPLLAAGLALVTLHLLDLALSGPDTALLALLGIVAVPLAWWAARPHVIRPTRLVLGVGIGLVCAGVGIASHGLHVVNSGPDWRDVTGVGMVLGGLLLAASGITALAASRRPPRRPAPGWRAAHGLAWIAGAAVAAIGVQMLYTVLVTTHAPRWEIQESSLSVAHEEVTIPIGGGRELSAWYVPSRNGAAVLVSHGSGGSRERVVSHIRMLARHGYGVLALDNPGNGESDGHSNGLGDNAQPGVDAALDHLARRPDVDRGRIAGLGTSLGGEVLLEAASHDSRLRAVVSDGSARPEDNMNAMDASGLERAAGSAFLAVARGISGSDPAPSLVPLMPRIAPRPTLLIASGAAGELETNRVYRDAGGPTAELWELPRAGHTAGLRTYPAEYERRVIGFLDRAI